MTRFNTLVALGASACIVLAAGTVTAMPVEQDYYSTPGVTEDGRLDIKEIEDNSTEMEMRLTKQLMVLQQQILDLQREIATIKAAMPQ